MNRTGRILYRVVITHLLVALPPALVLGLLVLEINRGALTAEAQNVHLAVAARLRDALLHEVTAKVAILDQAERILDMSEVPIERRKELLRALVAGTNLGQLGLFGPDGKLDSLVRAGDGPRPADLEEDVRREAEARGWAAGRPRFEMEDGHQRARVPLMVPWKRDGGIFGWVATDVDLGPFNQLAARLRDQYLGPDGEADLIDGARTYLVSARPALVGGTAGDGTPFSAMALHDARGGLVSIETGLSMPFVASDGTNRMSAVVSAPELRWIVGTSRPERIALSSIFQVERRVLLMSIIAALAAGLVGLALARHITDPIGRLIGGIRRTAATGFKKKVDVEATAELALLRDAFNEALDQLEAQRALVRQTTQVRLRLSRFLSPTALHEVITSELRIASTGREEDLTVLYADVIAPSTTASLLPRERLVTVLGDYFVATCRMVQEHGGRVDHYSGDAVIAIFAGEAAEVRALSAVAAARAAIHEATVLAARSGLGLAPVELGISIGISTGRGIVGPAPDEPDEISVVGPLVERAAAIQRAAAPGAILIDAETRRIIGGDTFAEVRRPDLGEPAFRVPTSDPEEVRRT